jgi:hypothetical protein
MNQSSTEGELVCITCGNTRDAVLEGVRQTYRDIHTRQSTENYNYSKCGHLDFHLQKLQGKPVDLPPGMLDNIKKHMENDGVSPKNLTIKKMRVYLQIIKQTEFYEDANYIIECLGGPKAPKLDKDLNELVKSLFVRILVPFRKIKKTLFATTHNTDRRNLVIYNFILYKIFEMLKKEEYLKHLCLLKTSKINIQLEHFWYYTCKECNFEYTK